MFNIVCIHRVRFADPNMTDEELEMRVFPKARGAVGKIQRRKSLAALRHMQLANSQPLYDNYSGNSGLEMQVRLFIHTPK